MLGRSVARQLLRFLCLLLCHSSLFRFLNRRQRRVTNGGIGELLFGHTFSSFHAGCRGPWVETHGYPHPVAPRPTGASVVERFICGPLGSWSTAMNSVYPISNKGFSMIRSLKLTRLPGRGARCVRVTHPAVLSATPVPGSDSCGTSDSGVFGRVAASTPGYQLKSLRDL